MPIQNSATEKRASRKRRDEIVDAAARVFATRGYHGASTQDIADVLGMRQASLYYYFASKEAALEEVCAIGTTGFIERAESIVKEDISSTEMLSRLLIAHVKPLEERPDYVMTFLNERKWLPTESRRRIGRMARRIEAIFEKVLRDGVRKGEFRADLNPKTSTFALLGMLNSVADWYERDGSDLNRIAATVADLAMLGTSSRKEGP